MQLYSIYWLSYCMIWLALCGVPTDFIWLIWLLLVPISVLLISYYFQLIGKKIKINFNIFLYFAWLLKEIILSSCNIIRIIWTREVVISDMQTIKTDLGNDLLTSLYANSITLTPGTVSLYVEESGLILVHALEASSLDSLSSSETMEAGSMFGRISACIVKKDHNITEL